MSPEKDAYLVEKYPKLFANRHGDMQSTAMCWGFECDDGWFQLLDTMCSLIQNYTDWHNKQRCNAMRYNRALSKALKGDTLPLTKYFSLKGKVTPWVETQVENSIKNKKLRHVPEKCHQVIVVQVKEKYGTLRFYYDGGDDYVRGVVAMAESISAHTCEVCGNPGTSNHNGWITVRCDEHKSS